MAAEETNIVNDIMKDVSPSGARFFRNVRGFYYTFDSVKALISAATSLNIILIKAAINQLRKVTAGLLAPGASDLVGFKPVIITPDMVGKKIAIFSVIEVKTSTGRLTPEQAHYIDVIQKNGGYAGVARNAAEARNILHIPA